MHDIPDRIKSSEEKLKSKFAERERELLRKLGSATNVLAERERELLEIKGKCSTCRLHCAHSGPCDIK